jgi:LexA-binding, inner membrane-associated putative hydrolase
VKLWALQPSKTNLLSIMDIFAHALWTGAALAVIQRHRPVARLTAVATVVMAALPDLVHLLPMIAWNLLGGGSAALLWQYVVALPGLEPSVPPTITLLTHHLHCIFHSAIVASLISLLIWLASHRLWLPLLGWWSHILIDVPTHSADFYPSPVLYPITQRGYDGVAWNIPWFMVANYSALCVVALYLLWRYLRDDRNTTP